MAVDTYIYLILGSWILFRLLHPNFAHHSVHTRSFGVDRSIAQRGTVSILLCQSNDGRTAPLLNAPGRRTSDSQEYDTVYVVTLENVLQCQNENNR